MNYEEIKLRGYIVKCIKSACKKIGLLYTPDEYKFEWIIVKDRVGIRRMIPIFICPNDYVRNKVLNRLKQNLYINFGIVYGSSEYFRCSINNNKVFEPIYTKLLIEAFGNEYFFVVEEDETECTTVDEMSSVKLEKLILTHHCITVDELRRRVLGGERLELPELTSKTWEDYKKLYYIALYEDVVDFEYTVSSGIKVK